MDWEVGLTGDSVDLDMLAKSITGPNFFVLKQGEEFVLGSPEFEELNDSAKIRGKALAFLEWINGAARVALDSKTPIGVGAIYDRQSDGRRNAYLFLEPAVIQLRAFAVATVITHVDGSTVTHLPADPVRDWVEVASCDGEVAKVLRLVGSGTLDWVNLYRVFEIVAADSGGLDGIESQGWASVKAMKLFKHTANSPGAIGTAARHGAESKAPPTRPMPLTEAKSLVLGIVQSWLREKTATSQRS